MGKDTGLYHRNRTILRERTKRTGAPCYYCGAPFYWGRNTAHPLSFTADHVIPRAPAAATGWTISCPRTCNATAPSRTT